MNEIVKFLQSGTPWQILCAVLIIAIVVLWRRYVDTSNRLFDLAIQQVKTYTQTHEAIERIEEDLKEIRRIG